METNTLGSSELKDTNRNSQCCILTDVICLHGSNKQDLTTSEAAHFTVDHYVHAKFPVQNHSITDH